MTDRPALSRIPRVLIVIVAVCTLIEGFLQLGDMGVLGSARLRATAYEYGGFWPGLLRDWHANYPGQAYVMFVSYAFLHGGLLHLALNMITLVSIGSAVCTYVGARGFVLLYLAAVFGGALGYAVLSASAQPMVGASGGLFGLVGGLLAWNTIDRVAAARSLWPVARALLALIALNLVFWWLMDGLLAWQTHLGGFVAGCIVAWLIAPPALRE